MEGKRTTRLRAKEENVHMKEHHRKRKGRGERVEDGTRFREENRMEVLMNERKLKYCRDDGREKNVHGEGHQRGRQEREEKIVKGRRFRKENRRKALGNGRELKDTAWG